MREYSVNKTYALDVIFPYLTRAAFKLEGIYLFFENV